MKKVMPLMAAVAVGVAVGVLSQAGASGQGRGGGPQAPRPAQAMAPIDLTGYWSAVVTEDWRWRMVTPPRGDVASIPMSAEGRRVANAWDLDADNASGQQCKAFGVGGIMRQPGRLHIAWQDEDTLTIDFDAGSQTRLLHFDRTRPPPAERSWQGHSIAEWQGPGRGRASEAPPGPGAGPEGPAVPGGGGRGLRGAPPPRIGNINQGGSLRVQTTHFREGYLRKNGVPYSEDASITEYFHRLPPHPNGDVGLHVVTVIDDPRYLSQPFYTSTHFKLESDGAGWNPTPCHTDPPLR
jgi:hypothetical protein